VQRVDRRHGEKNARDHQEKKADQRRERRFVEHRDELVLSRNVSARERHCIQGLLIIVSIELVST
jgi:hypothetical protein